MLDFCLTMLIEMGMPLIKLMPEKVMDSAVWSTRPFDLETGNINRCFDSAATCYELLFLWVIIVALPCRPHQYLYSHKPGEG